MLLRFSTAKIFKFFEEVAVVEAFLHAWRSSLLFDGCQTQYKKGEGAKNPRMPLNFEIAKDVELTFKHMANNRYVQVQKKMLIDDCNADEVANFFVMPVSVICNIKHRAIVQFVETFNR